MSADDARFATRAVHAGPRARPDLRLGHPGDPPDLDLRAARAVGEFVEDYDYSRAANPTRARARARARRARGRPRRPRSPRGMAADARADHRGRARPATTSCSPTTSTAAPTGSSTRCSARWGLRLHDGRPDRPRRASPRAVRRRDAADLGRDADQPAAQRRRHRGRRRAQAATRSSPSTTRSPRRSTSARSSSAPTPSCTRRRSTSAGTPTPSAAR